MRDERRREGEKERKREREKESGATDSPERMAVFT
jgi:hypothetical protein